MDIDKKYYDDICFILKTDPLNDSDMLINFYLQEHGRTNAITRGIRKPDSKLSPLISVGNCVRGEFVTGRNGGLIMIGCTIANGFNVRFHTYESLLTSIYLCNLVLRTIPMDSAEEGLFELLYKTFSVLDDDNYVSLRIFFEYRFLALLGYGGDFTDEMQPYWQSLWNTNQFTLKQQSVIDEVCVFLEQGRLLDRMLSGLSRSLAIRALEKAWDDRIGGMVSSRRLLDEIYGDWFIQHHI
mgnify:CR=1 FL=1